MKRISVLFLIMLLQIPAQAGVSDAFTNVSLALLAPFAKLKSYLFTKQPTVGQELNALAQMSLFDQPDWAKRAQDKSELIKATKNNDKYTAQILLHFKTDPNITDSEGNTPIRIAAAMKYNDLVKILFAYSTLQPSLSKVSPMYYFSPRIAEKLGERYASKYKAIQTIQTDIQHLPVPLEHNSISNTPTTNPQEAVMFPEVSAVVVPSRLDEAILPQEASPDVPLRTASSIAIPTTSPIDIPSQPVIKTDRYSMPARDEKFEKRLQYLRTSTTSEEAPKIAKELNTQVAIVLKNPKQEQLNELWNLIKDNKFLPKSMRVQKQ